MYKLFISTYNEEIIIGLLDNERLIDINIKQTTKSHSVYLMNMVNDIINKNSISLHDLWEVIVVNGPGSFTGIRLGVTVAKMLAYTLNIKLKEISSIEAIAYSIEEDNKIITLADSKGKYIGIFKNNKLISDIIYVKNEIAGQYIKIHSYNVYENHSIILSKIIGKLNELKDIEIHSAKPIYIKQIEALSDK